MKHTPRTLVRTLTNSPSVSSLFATMLFQLLTIVTGTVLARALGPESRGELATIILWPSLIAILGQLGISESLTFRLARGQISVSQAFSIVLLVLPPLAAILIFGGSLTLPFILDAHSSSTRNLTILFLGMIPASILTQYSLAIINGVHRYRTFQLLRLALPIFQIVTLIFCAAVGALNVSFIVTGYLISYYVGALVTLFAALRFQSVQLVEARSEILPTVSFGLRSWLGGTSGLMNERFDQLAISVFLSSATLGLYVVAATFSQGVVLVGVALSFVILPSISSITDSKLLAQKAWSHLGVALALSLAAATVLIPLIPFAMTTVFGEDFAPATTPARVLVLAAVFLSVGRCASVTLRGMGQPTRASFSELMALVMTVSLLALLLPRYGMLGAAIASLAAYAISCIFNLWQLSKLVGYPELHLPLAKISWMPSLRELRDSIFAASSVRLARPRVRLRAIAIVAIFLSIAVGSLMPILAPSLIWMCIFANAAIVAIALGLWMRPSHQDVFDPLLLFAASFAILFVLRPLFDATRPEGLPTLLGRSTESTYAQALIVAFVGFSGFLVGNSMPAAIQLASSLPSPPSRLLTGKFRASSLLMIGVALSLFSLFVVTAGGPRAILNLAAGRSLARSDLYSQSSGYLYTALSWIGPVGVLILATTPNWKSRGGVIGGTLVLASQTMNYAAGGRSTVIPIFLATLVCWYLKSDKRPSFKLIASLSFIAFFLLVTAPREYRDIDRRQGTFIEAAVDSFRHPERSVRGFFEGLDTAMPGALAQELQVVPSVTGYRYGATYLQALARPVPRSLWPDKPRSGDEQLMEVLWPDFTARGIQFYFSIFGEPYLNFGYVGVFGVLAVFGLAWRVLWEWYRFNPRNPTAIAIYATSYPFLFVYFRGGIGVDYQRQLTWLMPIVFISVCSTDRARRALKRLPRSPIPDPSQSFPIPRRKPFARH